MRLLRRNLEGRARIPESAERVQARAAGNPVRILSPRAQLIQDRRCVCDEVIAFIQDTYFGTEETIYLHVS